MALNAIRAIYNPLIIPRIVLNYNNNKYLSINSPCNCKNVVCEKTPTKKYDNQVIYYEQNFLDRILGRRRVRKKPPIECCKLIACRTAVKHEIPQFAQDIARKTPGSLLRKTKGSGFILEVPRKLKYKVESKSKQELLMEKIEGPQQKRVIEDVYNPMPLVKNPCLRMIELNARKLHPLYKKLELPRFKARTFANLALSDVRVKPVMHLSELLTGKIIKYPVKRVFINYKIAELPRCMAQKFSHLYSAMDIYRNVTKECRTKGQYHFTECPKPDCKTVKK